MIYPGHHHGFTALHTTYAALVALHAERGPPQPAAHALAVRECRAAYARLLGSLDSRFRAHDAAAQEACHQLVAMVADQFTRAIPLASKTARAIAASSTAAISLDGTLFAMQRVPGTVGGSPAAHVLMPDQLVRELTGTLHGLWARIRQ
jgi:hypothetical protein